MIICLAAIATMIGYTIVKNNAKASGNMSNEDSSVVPVINTGDDKKEDEKPQENKPAEPEQTSYTTPVIISAPVESPVILKNYTETELVYNATMKHWATHQGIDYKAEAGSPVKAVYEGEVTSVTTTTLKGTTVVIKHADGFESSYSLLGTNVTVKAGDKVKRGQVIGYVAENGVFETADGAHLHFELRKDGKLVDPEIYSDSGNK